MAKKDFFVVLIFFKKVKQQAEFFDSRLLIIRCVSIISIGIIDLSDNHKTTTLLFVLKMAKCYIWFSSLSYNYV